LWGKWGVLKVVGNVFLEKKNLRNLFIFRSLE
jgi:hypothetical protein